MGSFELNLSELRLISSSHTTVGMGEDLDLVGVNGKLIRRDSWLGKAIYYLRVVGQYVGMNSNEEALKESIRSVHTFWLEQISLFNNTANWKDRDCSKATRQEVADLQRTAEVLDKRMTQLNDLNGTDQIVVDSYFRWAGIEDPHTDQLFKGIIQWQNGHQSLETVIQKSTQVLSKIDLATQRANELEVTWKKAVGKDAAEYCSLRNLKSYLHFLSSDPYMQENPVETEHSYKYTSDVELHRTFNYRQMLTLISKIETKDDSNKLFKELFKQDLQSNKNYQIFIELLNLRFMVLKIRYKNNNPVQEILNKIRYQKTVSNILKLDPYINISEIERHIGYELVKPFTSHYQKLEISQKQAYKGNSFEGFYSVGYNIYIKVDNKSKHFVNTAYGKMNSLINLKPSSPSNSSQKDVVLAEKINKNKNSLEILHQMFSKFFICDVFSTTNKNFNHNSPVLQDVYYYLSKLTPYDAAREEDFYLTKSEQEDFKNFLLLDPFVNPSTFENHPYLSMFSKINLESEKESVAKLLESDQKRNEFLLALKVLKPKNEVEVRSLIKAILEENQDYIAIAQRMMAIRLKNIIMHGTKEEFLQFKKNMNQGAILYRMESTKAEVTFGSSHAIQQAKNLKEVSLELIDYAPFINDVRRLCAEIKS